MINEKKAFQEFLNAENGDFCGFDFANEFHAHFDKSTALYTAVADDCATVTTPFGRFPTGADGITAYFFSPAPKKTVAFNRSIYFI